MLVPNVWGEHFISCVTASSFVAFVIIVSSPAANAGSLVMEISCGSTPLTDAKKCANERTAGSEIEIIVNPTTQKVQISVTKNSGDYFNLRPSILDNCSVVDAQNWICSDDIRSAPAANVVQIELIRKYGMHHGHYYHTLTGGPPPHYYTSSISGWRYWAYRTGILSLKAAEEYE
jgi:hypothetical protein